MCKTYSDISPLIDKYDAFLIDLWGVIHDGQTAYPDAIPALHALKKAGKTIIFISNAPKRAKKAEEGLQNVGASRDLYDHVITSGEVTYEFLKNSPHDYGKKYYIIAPDWDMDLLDGTDFIRTAKPQEADFVLNIGLDNENSCLSDYMSQLEACHAANLPMICANPDIAVITITGHRSFCAGLLATEYEKMGGKVRYFGKPYNEIYEKCLSILQNVEKSKIAAIGDNIETDISGANKFNIDSYFIAGGILAQELGIVCGQLPTEYNANKLFATLKIFPTATLPSFRI